MKRREFIESITAGLIAAGAGARLLAQTSHPKIMLFGLTAVSTDGQRVKAVLPSVSHHGAFICGPSALIAKLNNGKPTVSGPHTGIHVGHPHLGLPGTAVACLRNHAVTAGIGPAQFQNGLNLHLPSIPQLADQMDTTAKHAFVYPSGSIEMSLNGGMIRMPGTPSNNVGTHGVNWQFEHNGKGVGSNYALTDLLVFEGASPTMDIAIGPAKATLSSTDVLWFVNIPTFVEQPDQTVSRIEHAHEWFDILNSPVKGVAAVTTATFKRPTGATKLEHPCLGSEPRLTIQGGIGAKYFPPDSDPCFIASA